MIRGIKGLLGIGAAFAALAISPAFGQAQKSEPPDGPVSPNGLPMEALWDQAPEAPNGQLKATGPYYVSRWGDIVLRGRLDGNGRVVTALTIVQCGDDKNPARRVKLLGVAPKELCDSVSIVRPGDTVNVGVGRDTIRLMGRATGWTAIEFAQTVGINTFHFGWPPVADKADKHWGVTKHGALFRNSDGKHVFFAPGETVKLSDKVSFVVKPKVDLGELTDILTADLFSVMKDRR